MSKKPPLIEIKSEDFYPMRLAEALGCCRCPHYSLCCSAPLEKTPQVCEDVCEGLKKIWKAQEKRDFSKLEEAEDERPKEKR